MRRGVVLGALTALVMLAAGCSGAAKSSAKGSTEPPNGGSRLPPVEFRTAGGETVALGVEIADEPLESQCGLMFRTSMPEDEGMLFVFTVDSAGGFWMRNTLIPLSIAYVAADPAVPGEGVIVDILDMAPVPGPGLTPYVTADGRAIYVADNERPPDGSMWVTYPPRAPYRYAIETNQGWYARRGIAIGDRVNLATALAQADAAEPPPVGPC